MSKQTCRLTVWICNTVLAVLAVLSIVSYFFMPMWGIKLTYNLKAADLQEMINGSLDLDFNEIIGEEGIDLSIQVPFGTADLFHSFGANEEKAIDVIVEGSVDKLVDQLGATLNEVAAKVVRSAAKSVVKKEVSGNIKDYLAEKNPEISEEEVSDRLNSAGITDDYIAERTDAIIDKLYESGSSTEEVSDEIMRTVEDVYEKLSQSDDDDLKTATLTEEQKENIRKSVDDVMANIADENGNIDPDELINELLLQAMGSLNNSTDSASVSLLAADDSDVETQTASARLKAEVKKYIMNNLPENTSGILVWVFRGMVILYLLSSLAWIYLLVKIVVKLVTHANPTVKLKVPIWLGWLPFLICVCLPMLAIWLVKIIPALGTMLSNALPAAVFETLTTGIAFTSGGWIACLAAGICFAVSIFYIFMRKRLNRKDDDENDGAVVYSEEELEEIAASEE